MFVQTIHQTIFMIDPLDLIIAPYLIVYRLSVAELTALFLRSLYKDMVFVDVGAIFGYFTCLVGGGRQLIYYSTVRYVDRVPCGVAVK